MPPIDAAGKGFVTPRTAFARGTLGCALGGGCIGGDGSLSDSSVLSHSAGRMRFTFVFSAIHTELALKTSSFNFFRRRGMPAEGSKCPSQPTVTT